MLYAKPCCNPCAHDHDLCIDSYVYKRKSLICVGITGQLQSPLSDQIILYLFEPPGFVCYITMVSPLATYTTAHSCLGLLQTHMLLWHCTMSEWKLSATSCSKPLLRASSGHHVVHLLLAGHLGEKGPKRITVLAVAVLLHDLQNATCVLWLLPPAFGKT